MARFQQQLAQHMSVTKGCISMSNNTFDMLLMLAEGESAVRMHLLRPKFISRFALNLYEFLDQIGSPEKMAEIEGTFP
jgi:hypothetical protein